MDGRPFEKVVAKILRSQGFEVTLTSKTNDKGIDAIAQKGGTRFAIQAKHYSEGNRVGSSAVQKASGLPTRPDIDQAAIVTTSSFTSEAEKVAANRGVELIPIEIPHSGTKRRNQGRQSKSSANEDFINDPRVQSQQQKAGIEPINNNDNQQNSNDDIQSETVCSQCNHRISPYKESHIEHWKECDLPSNRPTNIPVEVWWDIKDEVTK